jgi:5-methylcytosine-specific restriction endonuclease McrA
MHVFLLLFIVILGIIGIEKPKLLADLANNLGTVKGIILNIIYILPFIMVFFNIDSLSNWINNKSNKTYQPNTYKTHWSEDPKERRKFKTKQLRKVSDSTKKIVASNQQWKCFMCHNLLDYSYEIDHNVPLFLGGTNNISNLHALCRNCHGKKTIMEKINNNI